MTTITVETGVAMPVDFKAKGAGINKYAAIFSAEIKPVLHALTTDQSFMYTCSDTANMRKNMVWYANKYGQVIGKRFVVAAVPNGIRFYYVGLQPATIPTVTDKDTKTIGDSLLPYVAPIIAPTTDAAETPADAAIVPVITDIPALPAQA